MFRILTVLSAFAVLCGAANAQDNPAIDDAIRSRVVEGVAEQVSENFYDSSIGGEIAQELRTALSDGAYDQAADVATLAALLSETLHPHDNHFRVRYVGPPADDGDDEAAANRGSPFANGGPSNYGFREVSILPGNVGYIDLRLFFDAAVGGETATAALNFIKHTDAVIIDVRQNSGGAPSMVQFLVSHFLDPNEQVAINTFLSSNRDYPEELMSLSHLPAGARPDVPLFVLTSGRTGSAGEAFPYHLQAMERAVIVGETTGGAGNPGGMFYAGEGFGVFVSTSRTRNPITGTNWEGVGVVPDVEAPADDALDTALALAYTAILETAEDPAQRTTIEWAREAIEAQLDPSTVDVAAYADILGTYGPRTLYVEGDALFYRRDDQSGRRLTPVGDDRFLMDGLDNYRLTIQRDGASVQSLSLEQPGAPPSVSMRSE